jgi:hypothetical protein
MKKIIVLISLTNFIVNSVTSQITKRNWMVGGNGEFSSGKTSFPTGGDVSSTRININPKIGYFPIDHFAFGLLFNYERNAEKPNNSNATRYTNIGIGPFARYYFLPSEKNINILVEGNGAYNQQSNNLVSTKSAFISYALLTGPVIYFNSSVGIEFLLGYKGYKTTDVDTKNSRFSFNIGIQVHLEKDK